MAVRQFVLLVTLLCQAAAFATDVPSSIDAVTVYPGGATITRIARIELASGQNMIRFTGLVDSIDADQLQVEVVDSAVQLGQIRLGEEQQREVIDPEISATQGELRIVQRDIQTIEDSSNAANLRLKFLESMVNGATTGTDGDSGAVDVNSWQAALEILQSGSEDASALIRANDLKKEELYKDLSVLQRALENLRGDSLATAVVELTLTADRALTTEIRIRYFQEDAYWSPQYESRLDSSNGELQLAQQAAVYQETDENWNNVLLTLSTSQPDGELTAPELYSEFLNVYDPVVMRERAGRMQSAAMSQMAMDDGLEEIVVTGTRSSRTDAIVGNFAVSYDTPGRSSILNDSDEAVIIDLARFNFNTDLVTQVVPRENTQAFLAARFVYDQTLPLYAGDMAVYVDGVFIGNAGMTSVLPQEEILLPMGQDRRIDVRAESQGGRGGNDGIVRKRKSEVTDYIFEIVNRRSSPSYVEVLDRIPVARNKDIEVEVLRSATPTDERDMDDRPGLVLWSKTLTAGEKWRIRHQYSISYPAKSVLQRDYE